MPHWKGMVGLTRLRMERDGSSKYRTARLASRRSLSEARRAMPTRAIELFSLFIRLKARGGSGHVYGSLRAAGVLGLVAGRDRPPVDRAGPFEDRDPLDGGQIVLIRFPTLGYPAGGNTRYP